MASACRPKGEVKPARQDDDGLRHGEQSEVTGLLCDVEQIGRREHAPIHCCKSEQENE